MESSKCCCHYSTFYYKKLIDLHLTFLGPVHSSVCPRYSLWQNDEKGFLWTASSCRNGGIFWTEFDTVFLALFRNCLHKFIYLLRKLYIYLVPRLVNYKEPIALS